MTKKEHHKRRNICLSDRLAKKAEKIGGDVSKGIRKALEQYKKGGSDETTP